nr:MAG TPA: hypothetical protein [Caudoviricetes sp.]
MLEEFIFIQSTTSKKIKILMLKVCGLKLIYQEIRKTMLMNYLKNL